MTSSLVVPGEILKAFNLSGAVEKLEGGTNRSFLVNKEVVLKNIDDEAYHEWLGRLITHLKGDGFRVSMPIRSSHGTFVHHGWIASQFEPGNTVKGALIKKLEVANHLHKSLSSIASPVPPQRNAWSHAHDIAWNRTLLPRLKDDDMATPILNFLINRSKKENCFKEQIVHCDLTGNILFHENLLPLVIDFSLTVAPIEYTNAILICDSIAWEGTHIQILPDLKSFYRDEDILLKAIIFRLSAAILLSTSTNSRFMSEYLVYKPIVDMII